MLYSIRGEIVIYPYMKGNGLVLGIRHIDYQTTVFAPIAAWESLTDFKVDIRPG
jgi:hypothetical protein